MLQAPAASSDVDAHTDWLEIQALRSADKNSSASDLIRALRQTGSVDAVGQDASDRGSEAVEAIADSAMDASSRRASYCKSQARAYPYSPVGNALQFRGDKSSHPYVFLLLLSYCGVSAGPTGLSVTKLFEELSGAALKQFLGPGHSEVYQFGFPRRLKPAGFVAALDDLCSRLGEGVGALKSPETDDQNDAKLDLVAWAHFRDGRAGKIIVFGQCAAGSHWRDKRYETRAEEWCRAWMQQSPLVSPVRSMFIPHTSTETHWRNDNIFGGIMFDRLRLAALLTAARLDPKLRDQIRKFNRHVLAGLK